jgi:hypothetical protein
MQLMMLNKLTLAGLVVLSSVVARGQQDGNSIVRQMYSRYAGKWYSSLTFEQTTLRYRNDSLTKNETWHETILFPDRLRIDVLPGENHNTYILTADSTFIIRKGVLANSLKQDNDLTFLLGGMYFMPLEQTLDKFKALGYDLSKSYEDTWKGKPVLVIGASGKDDHASQLWLDKEQLYLVRMIKYGPKSKEEGTFDDHIQIGGGWTETKSTFYINDKLFQDETYHHCRIPGELDQNLFNPLQYVNIQ